MYTFNVSGTVPAASDPYQSGVCNIGPAEIARRRAFGNLGAIVTLVLFAGLVVVGAPHWTRLVLFIPAAGAASGYLQAMLHFCSGFGSRGVFNFGELGTVHEVLDPVAKARDRRRSMEISLGALALGIAVALIAALLPV